MTGPHGIASSLLLTVLLQCTAPSLAQDNLLANPDFDLDLAGWSNLFSRPAIWMAEDSAAAPDSGSALLGHPDPGNGGFLTVLSQCIPISTSGFHRYGAWIRNPAGQPVLGSGIVLLQQHFNGNCTHVATSHSTGFVTGTGWELREAFADILADTQSVRFDLAVGKPSGSSALHESLFDRAFLVSLDAIFSDDFESAP